MIPQEVWQEMKSKPGSQSIATLATLQFLYNLCWSNRITSVLELGGGIGTITRLLKRCGADVDVYEDHPFCVDSLKEIEGIIIITDYKTLPPKRDYDLVIVDGGNGEKSGGYIGAISVILAYVNTRAVYVEGVRSPQRMEIIWSLARRYSFSVQKIKSLVIDGKLHKGGTIYLCWPNNIFARVVSLLIALFFLHGELFLKRHGVIKKKPLTPRA